MTPDELQRRTQEFALRVIRLVNALQNNTAGREIGRQLLKSGTSVSANYRAARRGRSKKEYIAKIGIVVEEADETEHWLDLIMASGIMPEDRVKELHQESIELMKIFSKTKRSAKDGEH